MPGQTPDGPAMAHALAIAGAHSNGLTVACADRVGIERGQPFVGRSLIVGAQGWTVAGPASHDREEIGRGGGPEGARARASSTPSTTCCATGAATCTTKCLAPAHRRRRTGP